VTEINSDVDARLRVLEEAAKNIPLIDPTANVLSLVAAAITRQDDLRQAENRRIDDLRKQAEHYTDKIAAERLRSEADAKAAEARRIDALLVANTNNVALALEKQSAQAMAQDKRIAVLELNQYQGVGAAGQRIEGRQQSQWNVDKLFSLLMFLLALAALYFKMKP
jgi:hypothetical protein